MFDSNKFDLVAFNAKLDANLLALQGAEKITKAVLIDLSRDVLEALHTNEDVRPVNAVLNCLTPMNKKTATLYFKAFLGFKWDEDNQVFTSKNKKTYDEARAKSQEFLEDPLNNIWTWAARNVSIEPKEFSLEQVTEASIRFIKKGEKAGINKAAILRAMLAGGIDLDTLMSVFDSLMENAPAAVPAAAVQEAE